MKDLKNNSDTLMKKSKEKEKAMVNDRSEETKGDEKKEEVEKVVDLSDQNEDEMNEEKEDEDEKEAVVVRVKTNSKRSKSLVLDDDEVKIN